MSEPVEWELARYLLPQNKRCQEFWKDNWPIIQALSVTSAILNEREYFFKKNEFSRNDAVSLVVFLDLAWQQIKLLSGKEKKDEKWFEDFVPENNYRLYDEHKNILDNILWIYELHSALRHPNNEKIQTYAFIFNDPWPKDCAERLLMAANSIDSILSIFESEFDENAGFEGDATEKRKLAHYARSD